MTADEILRLSKKLDSEAIRRKANAQTAGDWSIVGLLTDAARDLWTVWATLENTKSEKVDR